MLQKLNERIQGVIAWVVIFLIAVTFTLFGVDYYLQSHQASDAEVTVNGEAITKHAYELGYRRARQQDEAEQMTAANEVSLKKQVLDSMIFNTVTAQAAKNVGFSVSLEQANAAIVSIPQFQEDGHFSSERYQQALNGAMFTPDSFRTELRQGMLLNQQRFAFIGTAFALPNEVKRFVKLYLQTRDYDYLRVSADAFVDKTKVSEAQVAKYYKKHTNEFISPEKIVLEYVKLSAQDVKANIKITDAEVARYYDENQSNYLTPAQWKVAHILLSIPADSSSEQEEQVQQQAMDLYQNTQNAPEQFQQKLQELSADKLSSDGVLPWIKAGQTEFDKPLANLTQVGQISEPYRSANGYEIFKLIDYRPAKLKPLSLVKDQINEQLLTEKAQVKYAQLLETLTDQSYQTPDSLDSVADALNLKKSYTEPFTRAGGKTELTANKQIINTSFSHDVLELGNNSEPIQLDNDSVVVIRMHQHIPAQTQDLAVVKQKIIERLALKQAGQEAKTVGQSLLAKQTDDSQNLPSIRNFSWQEIAHASRDTDKVDTAINDLAFSMAKPDSQDGVQLSNGDFVIVKLKKINNGQMKSLDKEQQSSLSQQIEASYGLMDYDLYVNNLMKNAKIEKHS